MLHMSLAQVVGAYGFMHPIVPPCPSAEEYRRQFEEHRDRSNMLQDRLDKVYAALEDAETDLDRLYDFLENCDCCLREYIESSSGVRRRRSRRNGADDDDDDARTDAASRRHEHVRGAAQNENDREARHGVRSSQRHWRSERGSRGRSGSEF